MGNNSNNRFVIKVAGSAGQGIKSTGLIICKAFKKSGFNNFGYTEYPSLIRGGHNTFQIEVTDFAPSSVSKEINVLLALNEESINLHINEIKANGILLFDSGNFAIQNLQAQKLKNKNIAIFPLNLLEIATDSGGTSIMKNTVLLGAMWKSIGLKINNLQSKVKELYSYKGENVTNLNNKCLLAGYLSIKNESLNLLNYIKKSDISNHLTISGNEAIGLGAISGKVKLYSSYPMTPSSSILTFLAVEGPKHNMIVKQAEDEITASNMVVGSNFAGARALCATSGGGLDLMSETISLAGITETPFVVIVGQRPGPATGVPTWTAQSDLLTSINVGHGEFARIVIAPYDAISAYKLIQIALNYADYYQTPVIFLTDKYLAESYFTTQKFLKDHIKINKGKILTNPSTNSKRYQINNDGISYRWFPGTKASPFLANSDEHNQIGDSTEDATEIADMIKKRMQKINTITKDFPDPEITKAKNAELIVVSFGSTISIIEDVIKSTNLQDKIIQVKYTHLWPLKTDIFKGLQKLKKPIITIENNFQSQLAQLLEAKEVAISKKYTKFDGRQFFYNEIEQILFNHFK